ncbi:hypothetical protein AAE021_00135 [Arthrobacter citreus]|uniref:Uncharacterized protein n=1 Tax=Arthrobacter citreus TaxID=1670 RepID=A0ABZ2ZXZ9_9MICC
MIWIHYALQTPTPEVTLSPVEQFARSNAGLISLAVLAIGALALVVPIYLDIRKERKAKKEHATAPKKIWLRRVWLWATDKWKRLRTPLEGRMDVRTQPVEAQTKTDELRQEREDWKNDHEATRAKLLEAQNEARGTQIELQAARSQLDVARYERQEAETRNVQLDRKLAALTMERDELEANLVRTRIRLNKLDTKASASQTDLEAACKERDDLRQQKEFMNDVLNDFSRKQQNDRAKIAKLTSQLEERNKQASVDFKAPDIDPEWFITGNDAGLRLHHLRGDTVRHVYVKAAVHGVAVTGGIMDPMFEGSELQFDVRPRYAHLDPDGRDFYVHWTDAKGEERSAHLESHLETDPPF